MKRSLITACFIGCLLLPINGGAAERTIVATVSGCHVCTNFQSIATALKNHAGIIEYSIDAKTSRITIVFDDARTSVDAIVETIKEGKRTPPSDKTAPPPDAGEEPSSAEPH